MTYMRYIFGGDFKEKKKKTPIIYEELQNVIFSSPSKYM
jgi:hypothetical protein